MSFNKRSQQRIGDVVRRVEKSPINSGSRKRKRRQAPGIKPCRLVRPFQQNTSNPQSVVNCRDYEIRVTREGEEVDLSEMEVGDDVELVQTGELVLCCNPRQNLLNHNVLYYAFKVGKFWCLDNQAVFQSWNFSED